MALTSSMKKHQRIKVKYIANWICSPTSENYCVLQTKVGTKFHEIQVLNIETEETWKLGKVGPVSKNCSPEILVNEKLLVIRFSRSDKYSTLKVWSIKTHELLFENDKIQELHLHRTLLDDSLASVTLFQTDKVEVLSFNGTSISKSVCYTEELNEEVLFARVAFPYILFSHMNHIHSMIIWKWDESRRTNKIREYKEIFDFKGFVNGEDDGNWDVTDATFVNSLFIASGIEDYNEEYSEDTNVVKQYCSTAVIWILNEQGTLLRRFHMKGIFGFYGRIIAFNGYRLIVNFDEERRECVYYMVDMEKLMTQGFDKVPYTKLDTIGNAGGRDWFRPRHRGICFMDKTSITELKQFPYHGGVQKKRLDFWAIDK